MGKKALNRRLMRQGRKGGLKPRTAGRLLNKGRIKAPPPPPSPRVETLTANQGGKVESYQDQGVRKFGGGRIKKQAGGRALVPADSAYSPQGLGMPARKKAVGRPYLATNTGEPTNVRKKPKRLGGFSKGGKTKTKK